MRHRNACSDSINRRLPIVRLLLFLAIGLLTFGISNKTWFDLQINLSDCTQCGEIIVAVGSALERSLVSANFTVEDHVRICAGVWDIAMCTHEHVCLDMKLCNAAEEIGFLKVFSRLFVSLRVTAAFLHLGFVVCVVCFISACTTTPRRTTLFWLSLLSGFVVFASVFVSALAYVLSFRDFDIFHISIYLPLSAIVTFIASLPLFLCAFYMWKTPHTYAYLVTDFPPWKYWKHRRKCAAQLLIQEAGRIL